MHILSDCYVFFACFMFMFVVIFILHWSRDLLYIVSLMSELNQPN